MHSLRGLVDLWVNQKISNGTVLSLLDSNTTRDKFYWHNETFDRKYITLNFQQPVWVNQIQFQCDRATTWRLHFIWQYWEDDQWVQLGDEYNKSFTTIDDPYLGQLMTFTQNVPFRPGNKNMFLGV